MKRFYGMLPREIATKLRNVIEFNGGITDTYLHPAQAGVDTWNVLTGGSAKFRPQPGGQPQPRIPGSSRSSYSIVYYPHDVKRNPQPGMSVPIEHFFDDASKKLIAAPKTAGVDPGSAGQKNPDVFRYDPSGLRSSMTANWTAMRKELDANRPNHLNTPSWQKVPTTHDAQIAASMKEQGIVPPGLPRDKRPKGFRHSHSTQW